MIEKKNCQEWFQSACRGHSIENSGKFFRLVGDVHVTAPTGFVVAEEAELLADVQASITACKPLFACEPVTEVATVVKMIRDKKGEKKIEEEAGVVA